MRLIHFAKQASGGIATNDRGNGAGGPGWFHEDSTLPCVEVVEVTEEEDPDAWKLARDALISNGFDPSWVEGVAVEAGKKPPEHQMIYVR